MVEGYIPLEQMKLISPLLTAGGDVYRAHVVGYYEQSAPFSRVEATIDASESPPKVITYRRMDHLERGFSAAVLGQRGSVMTN